MQALVSVIVPIYNVAPYILRCLESIAAQSYQPIECLLIDDCGTDDSISLTEQFISEYKGDIRFSILHHEQNKGLSCARNTGMKAANGDYIYFLDSDDAITSDCIETLMKLMQKYPDADYVQGEIISGGQELMKGHTDADVPEYCNNKKLLEKIILSKTHRTAWNRLFKHTFLLEHSLFFPVGILMEDHYWNYFVAKQVHAVAFAHKSIYYYYNNVGSLINSPSKESLIKRYSSYIVVVNDLIADMLQRSDLQQCHRTYVAEALTYCMKNLSQLNYISHWMIFWKFTWCLSWKLRNKFSWYRLFYLLCMMPPLCFMISINGWRWRLREFIAWKL